jgi:hypothetical protein
MDDGVMRNIVDNTVTKYAWLLLNKDMQFFQQQIPKQGHLTIKKKMYLCLTL